MNLVKTSCCAIQDIDRLSVHTTPREAMVSFCQQAILKPPVFQNAQDVGRPNSISSFFLFTAAVGAAYKPYGEAFYNFILENNLGEVWQSPLRPNKAWHPDHENQVYVWMPNHDNLKAWWALNDPDKTEVVAVTTVKRARKRKIVEVPVEPECVSVECPF